MFRRRDGDIQQVYWSIVSKEKIQPPDSIRSDNYDLIVIGGGYCGLSTALHAAEKGLSVLLLEASTIGCGASGRNGGAVVPTFPGALTAEDINMRVGVTKGEDYARLVASAPEYLFRYIQKHTIQCFPVQQGFIQPAHSEKSLAKVRRVYQSWLQRGVDIHWLSGEEIKQRTGAHGYIGGWYQASGGTVEPFALAQGLARVALAAGIDILEHHPVLAVDKQPQDYLVTTTTGKFRARKVLIATNAYTQNLSRPLGKSVIPVRLYHTMTRPLSEREQRDVLPQGITFTDLRKSGGFGRLDSLGRLQSGGAVFTPGGKHYGMQHARHRMQTLFPSLAGIELEYYWEGYCALSDEWIPSLQQHDPGFYSCIGFSTRGVAISFLAGKVIADIFSEEISADDSPLYVKTPRDILFQSVKEYASGLIFPIYKAKDRLKLS